MNLTNHCDHSCYIRRDNTCRTDHKRVNLEARLIRQLVTRLRSANWNVYAVHDGEERHTTVTQRDVLETVFSVDESTVHVRNIDKTSWFQVVLGNGIDLIPDYGTRLTDIIDALYDEWSAKHE